MFDRFKKTPTENADNTIAHRQRRLMAETVQVEEELLPAFVRPIIGIVAVIIVGFIVWAAMTDLTEVSHAPGEILPSGQIKVVQHLDGGTLKELLVEDRAFVKKGQLLARIDGGQTVADLQQAEARFASLTLRAERLRALSDERTPEFDKVETNYPELTKSQEELYKAEINSRNSADAVFVHQIERNKKRVEQAEQELAIAKQQQTLATELLTSREKLAKKHLVTRSVLIETQRAKLTADNEVSRLTNEIKVVTEELAELQNKRNDFLNQLKTNFLNELSTIKTEQAEVKEMRARLESRVSRLEVKSPVQGYIHDLKVHTIGQVIQPGGLLMQIVPDGAPLEAVVRIQPKDIGYVKVGQTVNLRINSFEYTRFGFVQGTLSRMTPSSIVDEHGNPYYRGWVRLHKPYIGDEARKHPLQPGMGVEAEIQTGEKTMLSYLAKPIRDVFSKAFGER